MKMVESVPEKLLFGSLKLVDNLISGQLQASEEIKLLNSKVFGANCSTESRILDSAVSNVI